MLSIGLIGSCAAGQYKYNVLGTIVFGSILGFIWLIACLAMLLSKTVVVTPTEIKMYRGKKLKWCIKKEEIFELIYNRLHWYEYIVLISSADFFELQIKLACNMKISKNSCCLSLKQVHKIKENFDYPFRIIDSRQEQ